MLHIELDGKYQNFINNWGKGMYNYVPEFGFTYEYIDIETFRQNLHLMKSKLKGLLFEIDPTADSSILQQDEKQPKEIVRGKRNVQFIDGYKKLKSSSKDNIISVAAVEFPRYKDILDYMVSYEYIVPLSIDGDTHMYVKQESFDYFEKYEMEKEEKIEMRSFDNKKVFIVHGHDAELLNEVELLLRRVGLEPIILKNEANAGRTIIEKIEELTDVGFSIVLYTACDEGRKKGTNDLQDRARQNVIFEHGFLYAKLGRNRVVALNDEGLEIPSDLSGVIYISRSQDDWKNMIMREMKSAGLEFDSTRA